MMSFSPHRLLFLLLLPALLVPSGLAHASAARLVAIEASPPVYDVLYRYGQVEAARSGAYGANIGASSHAWYLEEQRAGGVDVIDGVLRKDSSLIALGLRIFHYGLARQAPNGSFPGSAWPFHGVALFLSEAAPALLILQASPVVSSYRPELRWQIGRMRKAAYAMVRSVHGVGKIDDPTKTHRRFEAAIALGATGVLAHDAALRRWSTVYAWQGIHMTLANGIMPEDGGHDSGYQALGMINACRYLVLLAHGKIYRALYGALRRGEAWELSRVGPDGSINQTGDTRTVGCEERSPNGRCKSVFYAPIFSALAHWGAITGNSRYQRAAHAVWLKSGYGGH